MAHTTNSNWLDKRNEPLTLPLAGLIDLLKGVLDKGKPFRFQATGFSMSPFIENGDFVTLSPLGRSVPRLGDVVAFTPPGHDRLILHRVVGKKGTSFYIKGDSLEKIDLLLPGERVLARVSRVDRNGKKISTGFGPERRLVALLSRLGLLAAVVFILWKISLFLRWRPGTSPEPS